MFYWTEQCIGREQCFTEGLDNVKVGNDVLQNEGTM